MGKKREVQTLFDQIAPTYDRLNHLLSFGIDRGWRRRAIGCIASANREEVLDVACGTGDFALTALKQGVRRVVGVDISREMLAVAEAKARSRGIDEERLELAFGDGETLLFPDDRFPAVTVAFGVRNFEHLTAGLREIYRVLCPGGQAVILEFSTPTRFPFKPLYGFYFRQLLPRVGGWISGNRAAYRYLPDTVFAFPQGEAFLSLLREAGFVKVRQRRLTGGIATIYIGEKSS